MWIELHRKWRKKGYSIGLLYVDGQHICETVEDEDRGLSSDMPLAEIRKRKVKGQTAIPTGTYNVIRTYSPRFKRILPLIENVPGYDGIRIHPGNTAKDTEGCIPPGKNTKVGMVTNSRYWFGKIDAMIEKALKDKETVTITIHH